MTSFHHGLLVVSALILCTAAVAKDDSLDERHLQDTPAYWTEYKELMTTELTQCLGLKGIPPVSGTTCVSNLTPWRTCLFGEQICLDVITGELPGLGDYTGDNLLGETHPTLRCDCENGLWNCYDWDICRKTLPPTPAPVVYTKPPIVTQPPTITFCGGIAGFLCPEGMICIDDPNDNCDPAEGGADCGGICIDPVNPPVPTPKPILVGPPLFTRPPFQVTPIFIKPSIIIPFPFYFEPPFIETKPPVYTKPPIDIFPPTKPPIDIFPPTKPPIYAPPPTKPPIYTLPPTKPPIYTFPPTKRPTRQPTKPPVYTPSPVQETKPPTKPPYIIAPFPLFTKPPFSIVTLPPTPIFCGGLSEILCPKGFICIDDPSDGCDAKEGGVDCGGICFDIRQTPMPTPQQTRTPFNTLPPTPVFCGGIANFQCPGDLICVDNPNDSCDPNNGGADCGGICIEPQICGSRGLPPCPDGQECIDPDPTDGCSPLWDCPGICAPSPAPQYCGSRGLPLCPKGYICVDDPNSCGLARDCPGICVPGFDTLPPVLVLDQCPKDEPSNLPFGTVCSTDLKCEFGTETCCGQSHSTLVCTCTAGQGFDCFRPDSCFNVACDIDPVVLEDPPDVNNNNLCPATVPAPQKTCPIGFPDYTTCGYGEVCCCNDCSTKTTCACVNGVFECYTLAIKCAAICDIYLADQAIP